MLDSEVHRRFHCKEPNMRRDIMNLGSRIVQRKP
jgi:hypothetical protein